LQHEYYKFGFMLSKVWPVGQDRDFMIEIMDIKKKIKFYINN